MKILNKKEIKELVLIPEFEVNKWGTFYVGDGENFSNLLNLECDFFIKCEEIDSVYYTTFICNHLNPKNTKGFSSEWVEMYSYDETIKTTLDDIKNNMLNISGFNVKEGGVISNFDFYYAGLMGNKTHEKTPKGNHRLLKELNSIINLQLQSLNNN